MRPTISIYEIKLEPFHKEGVYFVFKDGGAHGKGNSLIESGFVLISVDTDIEYRLSVGMLVTELEIFKFLTHG